MSKQRAFFVLIPLIIIDYLFDSQVVRPVKMSLSVKNTLTPRVRLCILPARFWTLLSELPAALSFFFRFFSADVRVKLLNSIFFERGIAFFKITCFKASLGRKMLYDFQHFIRFINYRFAVKCRFINYRFAGFAILSTTDLRVSTTDLRYNRFTTSYLLKTA